MTQYLRRAILPLAIIAMGSAQASARPVYTGPYLGMGFGYGYVNTHAGHHGVAGDLHIGYKFNDDWAVSTGFAPFAKAYVSTHVSYAVVHWLLPLNEAWELDSAIGFAYPRGKKKNNLSASSHLGLTFGVGASYWISQRVGLTSQMRFTTGSTETPVTFSTLFGFNYFF